MPTTMLPITTERLTIRMMREPDLGPVLAYRSDPDIAHFQDWDMPYTEAFAQRSIDRQADLTAPQMASGSISPSS